MGVPYDDGYDEVLTTSQPSVLARIKLLYRMTKAGKVRSGLHPSPGDQLDALDTSNVWRDSEVLQRKVLAPAKAEQIEMALSQWIPAVGSYPTLPLLIPSQFFSGAFYVLVEESKDFPNKYWGGCPLIFRTRELAISDA